MRCVVVAVTCLVAVCTAAGIFDYSDVLQNNPYANIEPPEPVDEWQLRLQADLGWTRRVPQLGQVAGVDVDGRGNLVMVHRGDRIWGTESFDKNGNFAEVTKGKITEPVIVTLGRRNADVISKMGANRFFLPHGLTVDHSGNIWVTDVALHQVFKFTPGTEEPSLTLGTALVHGNDTTHFCKPTDVAVASNGQFFVSDGYCNHRIMKFAADGTFLKQWGHAKKGPGGPGSFDLEVPHGMALAEDDDMLCVADRENERIMCYYAGLKNESETGQFWGSIQKEDFGRVYAIAYDIHNAVMHMVNGPSAANAVLLKGTTFDTNTGDIVDEWAPPMGFSQPHDVAVSRRGSEVYVADIGYKISRVWKFRRP